MCPRLQRRWSKWYCEFIMFNLASKIKKKWFSGTVRRSLVILALGYYVLRWNSQLFYTVWGHRMLHRKWNKWNKSCATTTHGIFVAAFWVNEEFQSKWLKYQARSLKLWVSKSAPDVQTFSRLPCVALPSELLNLQGVGTHDRDTLCCVQSSIIMFAVAHVRHISL